MDRLRPALGCRVSGDDKKVNESMIPTIGVAFSGGGVRGLAHLGVLQVLEEAGIPVDIVAGTSIGGIVAGLYAAGVPVQDLIDVGTKMGIMDFASPDRRWQGLFGHKKMDRFLADLLGTQDITFEDLKIPAAVVAVDVETGELVVLDEGPLIPALLATSAFPVVFSPVFYRERWLIDGGVLNNLPIDIVCQMGADRVIGINVPPSVELPMEHGEKKDGLSLRALFSFANHTHDWKLPFLIAEAGVDLAARAATRARLALYPPDLLLEISLPNVGLFASSKNAQVIEAGRGVAANHMAELVALKTKPMSSRWRRRLTCTMRRLHCAWTTSQDAEEKGLVTLTRDRAQVQGDEAFGWMDAGAAADTQADRPSRRRLQQTYGGR
jgi:NTE family protein